MNKLLMIITVALGLSACKNDNTTSHHQTDEMPTTAPKDSLDMTRYPEAIQEVFKAHGGLQRWDDMKSLTYTMGDQVTITDVDSRDIQIETPTHSIGSRDGSVWIAQDSTYFPKEQARFYHNLMFYFYAMPFLLADDGIVYSEASPLDKDGIQYPGIKIAYEDNVGDSPEDNYILYYHPETKQMNWLAYTVTYGKNETSDQYSFIHYNKWQEINGLLLPEELTWYTVENGQPTDPKGEPRVFTKVDIDAAPLDPSTFEMPENGVKVD
ncbi:DUF6503 family protein [Nonlabens xiamenensis]|uniref:DUF6503 family protein n=1 Tax=Nonlabens xiamenensis TaxID=2341043 RepID=UPI000F615847|nr:DUF6503 family protein [Nonlabens xiamenensis]